MTIFGVDIASFQRGLSLASVKKQGYSFVMAKASEGRSYKNPYYAAQRDAAKANGLLFAAYHFLRSDVSVTDQARNMASAVNDTSIPVMIDCEVSKGSRPTLSHCIGFRDAMQALGYRVTLLYYPSFWWTQTGRPNLSGWTLWQALYGNNPNVYGSIAYPGDSSPRWNAMGGVTPTFLQFGSRIKIDGYGAGVDSSAFKGTLDELKALRIFKDWAETPAPSPIPPFPAPKPPAPKPPAPAPVPAKPKPDRAKTKRVQGLLKLTADGKWGKDTDSRAMFMRAAARAKVGYPKNVGTLTNARLVQQIIGTSVDGVWGPKSQAALVAWVRRFQTAIGTGSDGDWGPSTENVFQTVRKQNLNNF